MKGVTVLLSFLILQLAVSGCYTVLPSMEKEYQTTEVIFFYPPPPYIPPDPCPLPSPDPTYPVPPPTDPQPKIRQPELPTGGTGYRDQIRDPLRVHGERNNEDRKTRGRN